jgi:predicted DNA-binding ArsR family transcriptional regulator
MKKVLLFLSLMVAIISISACSAEQDPNVLKVSTSSDEIVGENYQTVILELEEAGFTNIETKVLDDLITGWLTKDGEIEQVEINGDTEFSANDSFQKDSQIVITYHTFPKRREK